MKAQNAECRMQNARAAPLGARASGECRMQKQKQNAAG